MTQPVYVVVVACSSEDPGNDVGGVYQYGRDALERAWCLFCECRQLQRSCANLPPLCITIVRGMGDNMEWLGTVNIDDHSGDPLTEAAFNRLWPRLAGCMEAMSAARK